MKTVLRKLALFVIGKIIKLVNMHNKIIKYPGDPELFFLILLCIFYKIFVLFKKVLRFSLIFQ